MTTAALRDNPCKPDCPRRNDHCHGDCPDYAVYNAANEVRREARQKNRPCQEYERDKGARAERKQRANK